MPGKMIWEVCCRSESTLSEVAHTSGFKIQRLTLATGFDMSDKANIGKATRLADKQPPARVWASCPCTAFSSQQNFNKRNAQQMEALKMKQNQSRKLVRNVISVMVHCLKQHDADLYFEWPANSHGWSIDELKTFHKECAQAGKPLSHVLVLGCRLGLKTTTRKKRLLKRWKILTTDELFVQRMGKYSHCTHMAEEHAVIQGKETVHSGMYPRKMCQQIVRAWKKAPGGSGSDSSLDSSSSSSIRSSSSPGHTSSSSSSSSSSRPYYSCSSSSST